MLSSELDLPPWVRDFYATVDANDGAGAGSRLAPDVELQFGARSAVSGREAAGAMLRDVHRNFERVSHEFRNVWRTGEVVICEFVATYRLRDGTDLRLPTLTVLERRGEHIAGMRVYIDEGPLRKAAEGRRA